MSDLDLTLMPLLFLGVPVALGWGYALRQTIRASQRAGRDGTSSRWRRVGASLMLGLLLLAGFLIVSLGPLWFRYFVQDSVIRRTEARVLEGAEIVYVATIVIATLALIPLLVLQIRRLTPVRVRFWTARSLVLAISVVLSAGVAEGVAVACLWAMSIPMPWLPVRFEDGPNDTVTDILVVGESSAQGVPYEKWLSVADIVAWKLGTAFPRMDFRIVNQATPGLSLQAMHTKLAGIERRPELVILYAGHNEFSSRFDWAHGALHYTDEIPPPTVTLQSLARRVSPLIRLIGETTQRLRVSIAPTRTVTRQLVDVPVYTAEQYADRLTEFGTRLGAIVTYLEWIGARVVLVIPPGNDAGFEPNRSFLAPETSQAERDAFAGEFTAARALQTTNRAEAEMRYRRLLEHQPRFAETHFQLARMMEQDGRWDEAFHHYVAARDLDGLPMRLPSDFQQWYRVVAAQHPRAILVDGPAEIHASAHHGLLDDVFFADGLHPSLNGYTVLAQAILTRLYDHHVFGWSADAPPPVVTPRECATHFEMNPVKWQDICGYSTWFYNRTAFVRHDPTERLAKAAWYDKGARDLKAGKTVDAVGIPGVGPREQSVDGAEAMSILPVRSQR
jgi:lysophospholipase L1-like esterase